MTLSYADFVRRTITLMSIILVTGLVAIAVWELASILLIVFFCWVLSVGLDALVRLYQRRLRIGRGLAGMLVILSLLLFFAVVAM